MNKVSSPLCGDQLANYDHRQEPSLLGCTLGDSSFSQQCSWRHMPSGTWRFPAFRRSYYLNNRGQAEV